MQRCQYAIALFIVCNLAMPHASQAAPEAAEATKIPADKLKVIKDLLVASRTTRNAKVGFDLVFGQEIKGMTAGVNDRIDRNPMMTAAQKADAKRTVGEMLKRRGDRFTQLVNEQMNMETAIEEVFIPMFDRHFTMDELKEMLAYYKSPVGQKALDLLPQMSMEAATTLNARLLPKLREISAQVDAEERESAEKELSKTAQPAGNAGSTQTSPALKPTTK